MTTKIYEVAIEGEWYGRPVFCRTEAIASTKLQETLQWFASKGNIIEKDPEKEVWYVADLDERYGEKRYLYEVKIVSHNLFEE